MAFSADQLFSFERLYQLVKSERKEKIVTAFKQIIAQDLKGIHNNCLLCDAFNHANGKMVLLFINHGVDVNKKHGHQQLTIVEKLVSSSIDWQHKKIILNHLWRAQAVFPSAGHLLVCGLFLGKITQREFDSKLSQIKDKEVEDGLGRTPLFYASILGDIYSVAALAKGHLAIFQRDNMMYTPLMAAASYDQCPVVKCLLAQPSASEQLALFTHNKQTTLAIALEARSWQVVDLLLTRYSQYQDLLLRDHLGRDPLLWVLSLDKFLLMKQLLLLSHSYNLNNIFSTRESIVYCVDDSENGKTKCFVIVLRIIAAEMLKNKLNNKTITEVFDVVNSEKKSKHDTLFTYQRTYRASSVVKGSSLGETYQWLTRSLDKTFTPALSQFQQMLVNDQKKVGKYEDVLAYLESSQAKYSAAEYACKLPKCIIFCCQLRKQQLMKQSGKPVLADLALCEQPIQFITKELLHYAILTELIKFYLFNEYLQIKRKQASSVAGAAFTRYFTDEMSLLAGLSRNTVNYFSMFRLVKKTIISSLRRLDQFAAEAAHLIVMKQTRDLKQITEATDCIAIARFHATSVILTLGRPTLTNPDSKLKTGSSDVKSIVMLSFDEIKRLEQQNKLKAELQQFQQVITVFIAHNQTLCDVKFKNLSDIRNLYDKSLARLSKLVGGFVYVTPTNQLSHITKLVTNKLPFNTRDTVKDNVAINLLQQMLKALLTKQCIECVMVSVLSKAQASAKKIKSKQLIKGIKLAEFLSAIVGPFHSPLSMLRNGAQLNYLMEYLASEFVSANSQALGYLCYRWQIRALAQAQTMTMLHTLATMALHGQDLNSLKKAKPRQKAKILFAKLTASKEYIDLVRPCPDSTYSAKCCYPK